MSRVWFINVIINYLLARWGSVPVIVCFVRPITQTELLGVTTKADGRLDRKEGHNFPTSQAYPPLMANFPTIVKIRVRYDLYCLPATSKATELRNWVSNVV
jgi:hypothetical protein